MEHDLEKKKKRKNSGRGDVALAYPKSVEKGNDMRTRTMANTFCQTESQQRTDDSIFRGLRSVHQVVATIFI
jgi:hypothetical protein